MSDDFGLPARRELPGDVRDRLRARVRQGIVRRRPSRAWYVAAAAAVVVLAAGAVVATRVVRQPADVRPAPAAGGGLTLDAQVATSSLDRCRAAWVAAGKSADGAGIAPPREDWVPLFTEVEQADSVVAATVRGEPLFCETTETTVTLSDPGVTPAEVPGVNFKLMLHSATGVVAGLLGPGAEGAMLESRTEGGESLSQRIRFSPVTRQFVVMTRTDPARTTLTLGNPPEPKGFVLPDAPPPLVSVVDRPADADRTSPAGRALGACLADAEEVVPDAAAYRPGPLLGSGDDQVVLGRRGDRVVVCTREPDYRRAGKTRARAYPDLVGDRQVPARTLRVSTLGGTESGAPPGKALAPLAGVLPATATEVGIDFGGGAGADAPVTDGMFAVWLPAGRFHPDANGHVKAWDAQGKLVYDGMLPLF